MNANATAAAINVDNEEIRAYPHAKHGDIRVVKKSGENKVKDDNIEYWTKRAASYSQQNRTELFTSKRGLWERELVGSLQNALPNKNASEVKVLDIGCGPGIFSVMLASNGYNMTAIDYTPSMIEQARQNASDLENPVDFHLMDAENLEFEDNKFDAIVTRNLTWDLPHPVAAYKEWNRVLKPSGVLINFDANWYNYLYQNQNCEDANTTRDLVAHSAIDGTYIDTNVDAMESIAMRVPLSKIVRPAWDARVLQSLGMQVECDQDVYCRIWNSDERKNFMNTPLFKIVATKL